MVTKKTLAVRGVRPAEDYKEAMVMINKISTVKHKFKRIFNPLTWYAQIAKKHTQNRFLS